jgi:pilus assembly protein FimV
MPLPDEVPPSSPLTASALDLDLDFSAADAPPIEQPEPALAAPDAPLEFSIDGDFQASQPAPAMEPIAPPAFELSAADLSFDMPADAPAEPVASTDIDPFAGDQPLSFDIGDDLKTVRLDTTPTPPRRPPANDNSLMSFDMGDLSLDMPGTDSVSPLEDIPEGDPLETKLSLATEFMAIGDMEGARSLAEEVVEQATGRLKDKARAFLADLG